MQQALDEHRPTPRSASKSASTRSSEIVIALDRRIKMAEKRGFEAPLGEWRQTRDAIQRAVLEQGFSHKLNSFIQSFDSQVLDATSLLIPLMEFLPADDPRVQGTVQATLDHLTAHGLVYRYIGDDGLPGKEGAFVLCTFWLVDALVMSGQLEEAEGVLRGCLGRCKPAGPLR